MRAIRLQSKSDSKKEGGRDHSAKPELQSYPLTGQLGPRELRKYDGSFVDNRMEWKGKPFLEEGALLRRGVGQIKKNRGPKHLSRAVYSPQLHCIVHILNSHF